MAAYHDTDFWFLIDKMKETRNLSISEWKEIRGYLSRAETLVLQLGKYERPESSVGWIKSSMYPVWSKLFDKNLEILDMISRMEEVI